MSPINWTLLSTIMFLVTIINYILTPSQSITNPPSNNLIATNMMWSW